MLLHVHRHDKVMLFLYFMDQRYGQCVNTGIGERIYSGAITFPCTQSLKLLLIPFAVWEDAGNTV